MSPRVAVMMAHHWLAVPAWLLTLLERARYAVSPVGPLGFPRLFFLNTGSSLAGVFGASAKDSALSLRDVAGQEIGERRCMRCAEEILESLCRAPDALSTKRHLLELSEVVLFRMHTQNELGQWEAYQLSRAIEYLRRNIEGSGMQFSTSWLSAAEASIVKSLVPAKVRDAEMEASVASFRPAGYEQLMEEVRRLRALLLPVA